MSLNQEKKIPRDLEIATLNQVWLLYQVSLNQVKITLQKPTKIWDQRKLDVKSEMLLNQVTIRRQFTVTDKRDQLVCYKTRLDTRLPQLRAGGQGLYLKSLNHLGRSSEAKNRKNPKKVKCDGRIDRRTSRPTDGQCGVWSRFKKAFI